MSKIKHEELGRKITDYHRPSYIDEMVKKGEIELKGEPEFIDIDKFTTELKKNLIRFKIDGDESESIISKFKSAFNNEGWNPTKGPICMAFEELANGILIKRGAGYTHRLRSTKESKLSDVPTQMITILDGGNQDKRNQIILKLYIKEQTYDRAISYEHTTNDIYKSLEEEFQIYKKLNDDWTPTEAEEHLENWVEEIWEQKVTDSIKKKIGKIIGSKSSYSSINYSQVSIGQDWIDHSYDGESNWCGIGNFLTEFKFRQTKREKTEAVQLIEGYNTKFRPIFGYDGELDRLWTLVNKMAINLKNENSDTKIMVFFGIGGTSVVVNDEGETRRKKFVKDWELLLSGLNSDVRKYINMAGFLPSDWDKDKTSIVDYNGIKRTLK